ncbi:phage tail protein [Arthrobacter sp. Z4-13]
MAGGVAVSVPTVSKETPSSTAATTGKAGVTTTGQLSVPEQGPLAPAVSSTAEPAASGLGSVGAEPGAPTTGTEPEPVIEQPPSAEEAVGPAVQAVRQRAARAASHSPEAAVVAGAQGAAKQPAVEQERKAAEATVRGLDAAQQNTQTFQRSEFRAALRDAIDRATEKPKTEAEAHKVIATGAQTASNALQGTLSAQKGAATGPLQNAVTAAASPSDQPVEPAAPLVPEQIGAPPQPVSAAPVVPAPLPPERLDYSSDRQPTESVMAEGGVTKDQLEKGNEPAFGQSLTARTEAEQHEAQVTSTYRAAEAGQRELAVGQAQSTLAAGLAGVHGTRADSINAVTGKQIGTQTKDAAERQRITQAIDTIKNQTRTDVETILREMETEASRIFNDGLATAEAAYERTFEEEKGGVVTWLTTWSGWDEHIESSLIKARGQYMMHVDAAIDKVANCIDSKLNAAKARVAAGQLAVSTFVAGLDASVQAFGKEALTSVAAEFNAMSSSIDERKNSLVDSLTSQYKQSYERMSAKETELREANKSLWQRVYDATVGLVKQILAFRDLLLSVLAKAAGVIGDIIADPIGFLKNLIDGVMLGLNNFVLNIGKHLKKGLMDWLFGALGGAGLKLPETFDLQGIVSIVLQVLGLTYENFRARAVKILGEPIVSALEKTAEVFTILLTEGVSGLWRFIKGKVRELKSMVLDAIFGFIKENVIVAGITWLVGLLNPASAFFKACKAIYDIIMFFVNRGSQILALVNAVVDSVGAIAKGSIGVAAKFVEEALAKAVPVAIGFLASLLGLGDISESIRKVINKAQAPVNSAIDWVINQAVNLGRSLLKAVGQGGESATINEAVPMDGKTHHLRDDGPDGTLVLHSEEMLASTIKDPEFATLVTRFNAAKNVKAKKQAADAAAAWLVANMSGDSPGASAPFIGVVGLHGAKSPSESKVELWALQSEHVIPFAVIRKLWEALGIEGNAPRKGKKGAKGLNSEDAALTTIMIYRGAAKDKDESERSVRSSAIKALDSKIEDYATKGNEAGEADTPEADVVMQAEVETELLVLQNSFVDITVTSIDKEHKMLRKGQTHGERRGEKKALPSAERVQDAATKEFKNAKTILIRGLKALERPQRKSKDSNSAVK